MVGTRGSGKGVGCGEGIRTLDLRVMSPTSCRCSTPRTHASTGPQRSPPRRRSADGSTLGSEGDGTTAGPPTTTDLLSYDPQWCLFWPASVPAFHLDIWLPYLRRSRYRFVLMAGEDRFNDAVRARVAGIRNVRILEPYELARAWLHLCPGFRGVLYVVNRPENLRLANTFRDKAHVFIGHGESDKRTSGFRSASLYDSLFVARYASVQRFPPAIRRWVASGACAIGAPLPGGVTRNPWTSPRPIRTVLYAPTWEGHSERGDYSSLPEVGPALVEAMPALTERGIARHPCGHIPMTGTRIARTRTSATRSSPPAPSAVATRRSTSPPRTSSSATSPASPPSSCSPRSRRSCRVTEPSGRGQGRRAAGPPSIPGSTAGRSASTDLVERLTELERAIQLSGCAGRGRPRPCSAAIGRSRRPSPRSTSRSSSVGRRRSRIPVRWVYEAKRAPAPLLRERP